MKNGSKTRKQVAPRAASASSAIPSRKPAPLTVATPGIPNQVSTKNLNGGVIRVSGSEMLSIKDTFGELTTGVVHIFPFIPMTMKGTRLRQIATGLS